MPVLRVLEGGLRRPNLRLVAVVTCLFVLPALAADQQNRSNQKAYVPPELQVTDVSVRRLLDAADEAAKLGKYGECLESIQKALELSQEERLLADKAIVEEHLALYYFVHGKLDEAKSQWLNSLSDGVTVSNVVLQADVLVALSSLQQASGHLDQALNTENQALDLARSGKSLYLQSRALGELSRLQLLAGKRVDARASIEEALRIDRLNQYDWEASHLLGLAWVSAAESNTDKALEFGTSARDLAVKDENYLVFIQASQFVGQLYVHTARIDEGIRTLELARQGLSEQRKPLFQTPDRYTRAASLPYLKITFFERSAWPMKRLIAQTMP